MVEKKIGIVGNRLFPFNEAYANQARVLAKLIGAKVFTCNDLGWIPFRKFGNYLIVNSKFTLKRTPLLSFLNGVLIYIVLKIFERKFDMVLLTAGAESEFLKYLNLKKCVPIISTIDDEEMFDKFISEIAPNLKRIIVQSRIVREKLLSGGLDPSKIYFMYPVVDIHKFKWMPPPNLDTFNILFASAPNVENKNENSFEDKGIPLLLNSFKKLTNDVHAVLYILWRNKYNDLLDKYIKKLNLDKNVVVINNIVDVHKLYGKIHITVIPYTSNRRSPQFPLSALESLISGRPVVTTDILELAELVDFYNCGCVAKPQENNFLLALKKCRRNYWLYHKNCKQVRNIYEGCTYEDLASL